jgi:hypothetical protein
LRGDVKLGFWTVFLFSGGQTWIVNLSEDVACSARLPA